MKKYIAVLVVLIALGVAAMISNGQVKRLAKHVVSEKAPSNWFLALRWYGTTDPLRRSGWSMDVYSSGETPGYLSARQSNQTGFKRQMTAEEMAAIYELARRAISMHEIGAQPNPAIADGDSLAIRLDSHDRSIEIGVHNSGKLSDDVVALVKKLNDSVPNEYRLRWKGVP